MQKNTEVLPIASTSCLSLVGRDSADIGGKYIPFKSSVRDRGVHLDQTLSMQQHISSVCCTAYLKLNSFSLIILDSKCNCPVCFICHNIPPWLLQFHPCRITTEADFTLTESPKHATKLILRPNMIIWHHSCNNCIGFPLNSNHSTR